MEIIFMSLGADVEVSIAEGYTPHPKIRAPTDEEKKACEANGKVLRTITATLNDGEYSKVMDCQTAKEIWDRLESIYQGDGKIKEAKLKVHIRNYDALKMGDNVTVHDFFTRLTESVNDLRSLGKKKKDISVVKKVVRELPNKFIPRIETIENSPEY